VLGGYIERQRGRNRKRRKQMKKILIAAILFVMAAGISLGMESCAKPQSVNINTATVDEIDRIPTVDRQLAANIVSYRSVNGPIISMEELLQVRGMSPERLEFLKTYIYIGWESPMQIPR
jgi:competence ComEA-like helix-hairpin-helix protein